MTQPAPAAGNSPASRDIAHVFHPYTNLEKHREHGPQIITRGKGIWLYDEEGRASIEGLDGLWCTPHVYVEERRVRRAAQQWRTASLFHPMGNAHARANEGQ